MMKSFVAAAFVAGLVGPASAATVIDFTADNAITGNVGGVQWDVTAEGGNLVQATHGNNNDCAPYACAGAPGSYDVGFGISSGPNGNEIDVGSEAVIVTFKSVVKILGFAGMLAYIDPATNEEGGYESVQLEYSVGGGAWVVAGIADAVEFGSPFDTVGLAFLDNLSIFADAVKFTATGVGTGDDGTLNVTAAALTVAPIPVPASFPLLLAGIGALGFAARRKRKSA
jgi:hypothetical protein